MEAFAGHWPDNLHAETCLHPRAETLQDTDIQQFGSGWALVARPCSPCVSNQTVEIYTDALKPEELYP